MNSPRLRVQLGWWVACVLLACVAGKPADRAANFFTDAEVNEAIFPSDGEGAGKRGVWERRVFESGLATLDSYLLSGVRADNRAAARMRAAYSVNERRALADTKLLFLQNRDLLSRYVSVSNDVYGFEIENGRLGTSLDFEGRFATAEGTLAEYAVSMVWSEDRWLIWSLDID